MSDNKCIGCDTTIPPGSSKCPMCGAAFKQQTAVTPVNAYQPAQAINEVHHHHHHVSQPEKPVLIEQTGKKWKKMYVWAWVFFFFGMTSCIGAVSDKSSGAGILTTIFFLTAFSLYIRARAGAWWNHG